jgi:ribosomal small subunit protein bTHX
MGKGDRSSKRGKLFRGTHGKTRKRGKKKTTPNKPTKPVGRPSPRR